jgi:hypothetical protein
MKRCFSKKIVKDGSEFKSFFRLRLQDRPIKLASKIKETYKSNKYIRKSIYIGKYVFGKTPIQVIISTFSIHVFVFLISWDISAWIAYSENILY